MNEGSIDHRKIERQREDFTGNLHTNSPMNTIRLEDLNLQGMKSLWGRKVNLDFADFVAKLKHIAAKKGPGGLPAWGGQGTSDSFAVDPREKLRNYFRGAIKSKG